MKFHLIAENLLSGKIKIAVLRFLISYPTKKFSGRELSRLLRSSPSSVLGVLELLERYGILHKTRIGKTTEWALNRPHILIRLLSPMLKLDKVALDALNREIKSILKKNNNIVRVILFGSLAKKEEKPDSDVDLFVLVKEAKYKKEVNFLANKLNEKLAPIFGNSFSIIVYSAKELRDKKNLGLVKHIKEEGQVIIDRG